ncbi:MAG: DUF448 domain-containing protein [Candidatus Eisenbacteria bacterium]
MAGRRKDRRADRAMGPIRTCRGCGRRGRRDELIRFVRPSGEGLFIGPSLPGRGFYVCPSGPCVDRLEKGLARWMSKEEAAAAVRGLRAIVGTPGRPGGSSP